MAKRVAGTTALLLVDWTPVTGPTITILNKYTIDDPSSPGLTKDGAKSQRSVTSGEQSGTLLAFLQGLLAEAKVQEGISA